MNDLRFIGWVGFLPDIEYGVQGETWTFQTDTLNHGKDEQGRDILTLTMHLDRPEKCIESSHNAHP